MRTHNSGVRSEPHCYQAFYAGYTCTDTCTDMHIYVQKKNKNCSNYVENIRLHLTQFSRTAVAVHCAKKMHVNVNSPTYTVLNVLTDAITLHFNQATPSNSRLVEACCVLTK
jgi:hypothetical protein